MCSALQISLVDLLASWNIHPDSVTGHSSGEIAAAYATGALSMKDAIKVAYYRGLCASEVLANNEVKGAMIAVGMSAEAIKPYISSLSSGKSDVACINSPLSATVSGDADAIDELADKLTEKSIFCRRLAVDVAYHSHHMKLVADEYLNAIATIAPRSQHIISEEPCQTNSVSFFSSVTGKNIQLEELGPKYWVSNLLCQVNFSDSVKTLCFETNTWHQRTRSSKKRKTKRIGSAQKASVDCLLEIGPHSALSGPIKQILQGNVKLNTGDILYLSILTRKKDAVKSALDVAATLASMNYPLDFEAINFAGTTKRQRPRLLVDMPSYCWNHTRSYWAEPRLSRTYRNKSQPRTDLLGTLDNIACPFEPRWRNFIRVSEIPWIVDHKIQSDIVFPAAGYLSMAVEAATQTARDLRKVVSFIIRNVTIHSALIVTEATAVEVMTSLRKFGEDLTHDSEECFKFHIYSVSKDNRWTEHCSGDITLESQLNHAEDVVIRYFDNSYPFTLGTTAQGIQEVDVDRLYERLQDVGLEYGPYFANLASAHATKNGACFADVRIPDTASSMPMNFEYPLLLHPCTLDAIFHTIFAALPDEMPVERGPIIPVSLDYMRLSYQMTSSPGDKLSVCTEVRSGLGGQIVASIVVAQNDSNLYSLNPTISISGLRGIRLEVGSNIPERSRDVPIAYGIEWQPDPGFMSSDDLFLSQRQQNASQERVTSRNEYNHYVTLLTQNAVEAFKEEHSQQSDLIYDKYRSSLAEMIRFHANDENKSLDRGIFVNKSPLNTMGRLISIIDTYLSSLSQIEEESFTRIHEELLNAYYEVLSTDTAYISASQYLKLIGFKKPDISILQLSGGAGKPLAIFLEFMLTDIQSEQKGLPPFSKYTFAYTDDEDYERARLNLEKWTRWIDFVKLDELGTSAKPELEVDNLSYDVIIAPHGLHSFQSAHDALPICRSLLKPSGYLIIVDPLRPKESILDNFLATILYLWPVGNFEPPNGLFDEVDLDYIIHRSGFSSNRSMTGNHKTNPVENLIICQPQPEAKLMDKQFLIIQGDESNVSVIECLKDSLLDISPKVEVSHLLAAEARAKFCIVINDVHNNLLSSPSPESLDRLKEVFLHSSGVLWISHGGAIEPMSPEYGVGIGFARTARAESAVKPILTLDLDAQNPLTNQKSAQIITRMIQRCFSQFSSADFDTDYAERNGILLIPRAVERKDVNQEMMNISMADITCEQRFREIDQPIRLSRPNGSNIQPHLVADFRMSTPPPTGCVRIEVMAFGLGYWDMQDNAEAFKSQATIGLECSGRVLEIGTGIRTLSVGDRVTCLGAGTARSYYQDRESAFQKIADSMTFEMGAALPVTYTTAYFIIHYLTRIRPDELILIQGAASLLGQAILEICCIREAKVLATVNGLAQKEFLLNRFAIPPERIFVEGVDNIGRSVLELTGGNKARVVITAEKSVHLRYRDLVTCVASFGHLVRILGHGDERKDESDICCWTRNISFSSFNIFDLQKDRADLARHIWSKVIQLFNKGKLHGPSSLSDYRISDLTSALNAIPIEQHVVVTTRDNEIIKASEAASSHLRKMSETKITPR